jgi:hypothetical protein
VCFLAALNQTVDDGRPTCVCAMISGSTDTYAQASFDARLAIPHYRRETKVRRAILSGKGYKGHNFGSRMERVHKIFDEEGEAAARHLAVELGIADKTIDIWISVFKKGFADNSDY